MSKSLWKAVFVEDYIHIVPIDDVNEHEMTPYCHCGPEVDESSGGFTAVSHNAYDGREELERLDENMNKKPKFVPTPDPFEEDPDMVDFVKELKAVNERITDMLLGRRACSNCRHLAQHKPIMPIWDWSPRLKKFVEEEDRNAWSWYCTKGNGDDPIEDVGSFCCTDWDELRQ